METLEIALQLTKAVLGHVSGSRSGIVGICQQHKYENEKQAALEAWARDVEGIVSGNPPNVVPIRGGR